MHWPGVEPGARPWEDPMLPLHHQCYTKASHSCILTSLNCNFEVTSESILHLARRKPSSQTSTSGPYRVLITRRWTHRPRFVTLLPYLPAVIDVGATPVPIDYPTSNSVSVFLIFLKMEQSNDHGAFQNLEGILGQREIVFLAELVWASPWHYCSQQLWSDKVIPLYWSTISSLIDWLCWTRLFKVLRRFFNNPNLAFNPPH